MQTKDKCKIIKKYLRNQFVFTNPEHKISVTKGTGTASGWIRIEVPSILKATQTRDTIELMAILALKEKGTEFYTYTCDDGYGTTSNCVNVHFN
jgi:hypothetical protein